MLSGADNIAERTCADESAVCFAEYARVSASDRRFCALWVNFWKSMGAWG